MIRIVHVSDLHLGAIEAGTCEGLLEAIESLAPTLVAVSGDLTLAGRKREFAESRLLLSRITAPTLVVPGNHDVPAYALHRRFTAPLGRYRRAITRDLTPEFEGDGLFALGLNTARAWDLSWNWSHGRLSDAQIRHADEEFARHQDAAVRALVIHHPLVVPEELAMFRVVRRSDPMLRVLARRRVDMVLAGHLHVGSWRRHEERVESAGRSILLVQASTATSTRRRDQPNAFNLIEIEGDRMRLVVMAWDGRAFVEQSGEHLRRDESGWASAPEAGGVLAGAGAPD